MKTIRLTKSESTAYANGERRFWRAMRKQPQPNDGKGLAPLKPYRTSLGTWTFVLAATGMGDGTSGIPCHYGTPGDRIIIAQRHTFSSICAITAITVEQRDGKWGWVVEVGA